MPQITLDVSEENIPLFMQITEAMGITRKNVYMNDESPDWHSQVLSERLERYNAGTSKATSWDDFEKELDSEDEATV